MAGFSKPNPDDDRLLSFLGASTQAGGARLGSLLLAFCSGLLHTAGALAATLTDGSLLASSTAAAQRHRRGQPGQPAVEPGVRHELFALPRCHNSATPSLYTGTFRRWLTAGTPSI
jgi:hypothetical protein